MTTIPGTLNTLKSIIEVFDNKIICERLSLPTINPSQNTKTI